MDGSGVPLIGVPDERWLKASQMEELANSSAINTWWIYKPLGVKYGLCSDLYFEGIFKRMPHLLGGGVGINKINLDLWGEGKEDLYCLTHTLLLFLTGAPLSNDTFAFLNRSLYQTRRTPFVLNSELFWWMDKLWCYGNSAESRERTLYFHILLVIGLLTFVALLAMVLSLVLRRHSVNTCLSDSQFFHPQSESYTLRMQTMFNKNLCMLYSLLKPACTSAG